MRTQQEQQIAQLTTQLEDLKAFQPQADVFQEHEVVDQDVIRQRTFKAEVLEGHLVGQELNAASCLSFLSALAKRVREATGAELETNIKVSNVRIALKQLAQTLCSMKEMVGQRLSA
jgi:hypothetical protein